jgi:hypothetical protein
MDFSKKRKDKYGNTKKTKGVRVFRGTAGGLLWWRGHKKTQTTAQTTRCPVCFTACAHVYAPRLHPEQGKKTRTYGTSFSFA